MAFFPKKLLYNTKFKHSTKFKFKGNPNQGQTDENLSEILNKIKSGLNLFESLFINQDFTQDHDFCGFTQEQIDQLVLSHPSKLNDEIDDDDSDEDDDEEDEAINEQDDLSSSNKKVSESLNNDKNKQTQLTCVREDEKGKEEKEPIDNCNDSSKDNIHLLSRSSSSSSISSSCSNHSMIKHYTNIIINNRESLEGQNVVRDKIERILKSQWEERLNKTKEKNFSNSSHFKKSNSTSSFQASSFLRPSKLQLNRKTLLKLRKSNTSNDWIFNDKNEPKVEKKIDKIKESSNSSRSGYITCSICRTTKYYSHVQRRYGQYSCESCSKFFAKFVKSPKQYYCSFQGSCTISPSSTKSSIINRCKACWLTKCIQKFTWSPMTVLHSNFTPKLFNSPSVQLITVDTSLNEESTRMPSKPSSSNNISSNNGLLMVASVRGQNYCSETKGPRVKRVCRRREDILKSKYKRARFEGKNEKVKRNQDEERKEGDNQKDADDEEDDSDAMPIDEYIIQKTLFSKDIS